MDYRAFLLLILPVPGCFGTTDPALLVAGPGPALSSAPLVLRVLADSRRDDLDGARRVLARYFDAPSGGTEFASAPDNVGDLPAPIGLTWLRVADEVTSIPTFHTPLGRLVLARSQSDVTMALDDFAHVFPQDGDAGTELRLLIRPDRRKALERITAAAAGGMLLFVVNGSVRLAVAVEGPASGDLLLRDLPPGTANLFLHRFRDG